MSAFIILDIILHVWSTKQLVALATENFKENTKLQQQNMFYFLTISKHILLQLKTSQNMISNLRRNFSHAGLLRL